MTQRRRHLLSSTATLALAFAGPVLACRETTSPDEPFSIEFAALPAPSIVSGDTLRDIEGTAVPLRTTVYNLRGDVLENVPVSYVVVDTSGAITIDPTTGHVVASGSRRGTVRIVASAGPIQSAALTFEIIPAPTAVEPFGTIDTLKYSFSNPALNKSDALEVRVRRDSANAGIPAYVVRFRLARLEDTIVARLVDDGDRRSPLDPTGATHFDTTEASGSRAGVAGRRILLTPGITLQNTVDTIAVFADVRLRGVHVTGSPVTLRLLVMRRPTTP